MAEKTPRGGLRYTWSSAGLTRSCWRGTVKGFRYSWREAGPLGSNHGAPGHVRAFL